MARSVAAQLGSRSHSHSSASLACLGAVVGVSHATFALYLRCGRGYGETMLSSFETFQCLLLEILRAMKC